MGELKMKRLEDYDKLFIFDTETTGLDYLEYKVIELGGVVLEKQPDGKFEQTFDFNYVINHGIKIPPNITKLTGVTQEMADSGTPLKDVVHEVAPHLLGNTLLIAYNAQFDINAMTVCLREVYGENDLMLENDVFDPFVIYKDRYEYPHRLENAIATMRVQGVNSHRAMDDALATLNVLRALFQDSRYDSPDTIYINVLTYNPKYGDDGFLLPHITYIPTKGGKLEIQNYIKQKRSLN